MTTYTYWIFYVFKEYIDKESLPFVLDSDIYAYTDSKKIAESFKSTRNMKYFICRKVKLDKSEVHDLTKDFNNLYLQMLDGTCPVSGMGSKEVKFEIPVTKAEKISIETNCYNILTSQIYKYTWNNPFIFKDEYVESLANLRYIDFFKYIKTGNTKYEYKPNLLNVFIKQFGFMLKI